MFGAAILSEEATLGRVAVFCFQDTSCNNDVVCVGTTLLEEFTYTLTSLLELEILK